VRVLISPKEAFKRVKRDFSREDYGKRADQFIERVIRFINLLRRNRIPVHTASEIDAVHALSLVDINDPFQFYLALKTCLLTSRAQLVPFNRLYMQFWGTGPKLKKPTDGDEETSGPDEKSVVFKKLDHSPSEDNARKGASKHSNVYEEVPTFTYSAAETLRQKDFEEITQSEVAMLDQVFKRLKIKIREKKGRRFKPALSGRLVDLRRTIRQSTQRGGEIIDILMRQRKPKESKIVIMADVSGSMDAYSRFLIKFTYEMQRFLRDTETFVFGTRLMRITDVLQQRSLETALAMVAKRVLFWSGGTDIGGCLKEFNEKFSGRYMAQNRILVILSDGWDKGNIEELRLQMIRLKRGFRRVIWLNPHLQYDDYQPLCLGMAAALPYVDHFLPCHNVETLEKFLDVVKQI
jgi:uncharacterized protein